MGSNNIERIEAPQSFEGSEGLLAIIIRSGFNQSGVNFLTEQDQPMQVGVLQHQAGHRIPAHVHQNLRREVRHTQEVLVVQQGSVEVDFYTSAGQWVTTAVVLQGDVLILLKGGHGFKVLEDFRAVECKVGPYLGVKDKYMIPEVKL